MKCNKVCYTKEKPEREIQKWQRAQEEKRKYIQDIKSNINQKFQFYLSTTKKAENN